MNPVPGQTMVPPRLTMDAYADFFERSLLDRDPERVQRQKAIEKRIRKPILFVSEPGPPASPTQFDPSQLASNLRRSVDERLIRHDIALNSILDLRQAVRRQEMQHG